MCVCWWVERLYYDMKPACCTAMQHSNKAYVIVVGTNKLSVLNLLQLLAAIVQQTTHTQKQAHFLTWIVSTPAIHQVTFWHKSQTSSTNRGLWILVLYMLNCISRIPPHIGIDKSGNSGSPSECIRQNLKGSF